MAELRFERMANHSSHACLTTAHVLTHVRDSRMKKIPGAVAEELTTTVQVNTEAHARVGTQQTEPPPSLGLRFGLIKKYIQHASWPGLCAETKLGHGSRGSGTDG